MKPTAPFVVLLVPAILAAPLSAQAPRRSFDLSIGASGTAQRVAVGAWWTALPLGNRWRLGLGARASAYAGAPTMYTNRGSVLGTLPASVTIDPAVYALDAAVFGELKLTDAIALGANLDLIGVAAGPARTMGSLQAKPQAFSMFRYGSADRGALNSEFFIALRVAPRVRARAGLSHYVTNYVVTDATGAGSPSSRYQRFETTPFVAVSLSGSGPD